MIQTLAQGYPDLHRKHPKESHPLYHFVELIGLLPIGANMLTRLRSSSLDAPNKYQAPNSLSEIQVILRVVLFENSAINNANASSL